MILCYFLFSYYVLALYAIIKLTENKLTNLHKHAAKLV